MDARYSALNARSRSNQRDPILSIVAEVLRSELGLEASRRESHVRNVKDALTGLPPVPTKDT